MENLDYYSVMEARIKYYALKYDPYNKLGTNRMPGSFEMISSDKKTPITKIKKVKRKFTSVLDAMISFLF